MRYKVINTHQPFLSNRIEPERIRKPSSLTNTLTSISNAIINIESLQQKNKKMTYHYGGRLQKRPATSTQKEVSAKRSRIGSSSTKLTNYDLSANKWEKTNQIVESFNSKEKENFTLFGRQDKESKIYTVKMASDFDLFDFLIKRYDGRLTDENAEFWAYTHRINVKSFLELFRKFNPQVNIDLMNHLPTIEVPPISLGIDDASPIILELGNPNIRKSFELKSESNLKHQVKMASFQDVCKFLINSDTKNLTDEDAKNWAANQSIKTEGFFKIFRKLNPRLNIEQISYPPTIDTPPISVAIDNYGPIIWEPSNPKVSKTFESEGIKVELESSSREEIEEQVSKMDFYYTKNMRTSINKEASSLKKKTKYKKIPLNDITEEISERMKAEARTVIENERFNGYVIEHYLKVVYDPATGHGVVSASDDLKANTFLGFYRGEKLNDMQLFQKGKAHGGQLEDHMKVQSYLFETLDKFNLCPVDGGNWLALLNMANMKGGFNYRRSNNVDACNIGKSLIGMFSIKDIPKGEPLLLDYGKAYKFERIKGWMAEKEASITPSYKITLTQEERTTLRSIASKGKHKTKEVLNALILLNCNESGEEKRSPKTGSEIAEILNVSERKIERVKKRFVEKGVHFALKKRLREPCQKGKIDGKA